MKSNLTPIHTTIGCAYMDMMHNNKQTPIIAIGRRKAPLFFAYFVHQKVTKLEQYV